MRMKRLVQALLFLGLLATYLSGQPPALCLKSGGCVDNGCAAGGDTCSGALCFCKL